MEYILEITAVLIMCGTFILLVWLARSFVVTPVPTDEDTMLYMVVAVKGGGCQLEQTLKSLSWLKDEGRIPMEVIVVDYGLDCEGQRLAELNEGLWNVTCCEPGSLDELIGDTIWRKPNE